MIKIQMSYLLHYFFFSIFFSAKSPQDFKRNACAFVILQHSQQYIYIVVYVFAFFCCSSCAIHLICLETLARAHTHTFTQRNLIILKLFRPIHWSGFKHFWHLNNSVSITIKAKNALKASVQRTYAQALTHTLARLLIAHCAGTLWS